MTEFQLIDLFTRALPCAGEGVVVGVGDDAAVLRAPRGEVLCATVDALVEGVHFDRRFTPEDVGWKALAVNLSDLAAMGARPLWALIALAVTGREPPARLARIARGLGACARRHGLAVAGGNVTRARDLSLTVTVLGAAGPRHVLRRAGARPGDVLLVSGTIGDAALGRAPDAPPALAARQRRPAPRLALGRGLAAIASAAIDVSDGLVQDLGHLCDASGTGATVRLEDLPLSPAYRRAVRRSPDRWGAALGGGEDYELLVAVPPGRVRAALAAARRARTPLTAVGTVDRASGLRLRGPEGALHPAVRGHDHLAGIRAL